MPDGVTTEEKALFNEWFSTIPEPQKKAIIADLKAGADQKSYVRYAQSQLLALKNRPVKWQAPTTPQTTPNPAWGIAKAIGRAVAWPTTQWLKAMATPGFMAGEALSKPFEEIQEKAIKPTSALLTAPLSKAGMEWGRSPTATYKELKPIYEAKETLPRFVRGATEAALWTAVPGGIQTKAWAESAGLSWLAKAATPVAEAETLMGRAIPHVARAGVRLPFAATGYPIGPELLRVARTWLPDKALKRLASILSKPAAQRTAAEVAELKAAEELAIKAVPEITKLSQEDLQGLTAAVGKENVAQASELINQLITKEGLGKSEAIESAIRQLPIEKPYAKPPAVTPEIQPAAAIAKEPLVKPLEYRAEQFSEGLKAGSIFEGGEVKPDIVYSWRSMGQKEFDQTATVGTKAGLAQKGRYWSWFPGYSANLEGKVGSPKYLVEVKIRSEGETLTRAATPEDITGIWRSDGKGWVKVERPTKPAAVEGAAIPSDINGLVFSGAGKDIPSGYFSGSIDKALDFTKARLASKRGGEPTLRVYRVADIETRLSGTKQSIEDLVGEGVIGKLTPSSEYSYMYLEEVKPIAEIRLAKGFQTTKEDIIGELERTITPEAITPAPKIEQGVTGAQEVGKAAKGPRSFFDISTPETSDALTFVDAQVKDSLSKISAKVDPVVTLKIDPDDVKYLNPDFVSIATTLYQKAGNNARALLEVIKGLGFNKASVDIKSLESFAEKVTRKTKTLGQYNPSEINDLVRATIVVDSEKEALATLRSLGDKVKNVTNYFNQPTNGYRGLNVDIVLPDGSLAEIQIHTPQSLAKAEELHVYYDNILKKITAPKIEPPPVKPPPPSSGAGKFDEIWKDRSQKPIRDWPEAYLKAQEYGNDFYFGLRRLQTQVGKKVAIEPGGAKDLITMLTRSVGAGNAGAARYVNAVRELKAVAPEASLKDISNIMDANHYLEVLAKKGTQRQMPKGLNEPELKAVLDETKARIGDDAYNAIENVVKTKNKQTLDELVSEGLISKEIGEELGKDYPWYFPLKYVEELEKRGIGAKTAKPLSVITNGLRRLTEEGTVKTAESPLETWGTMFINHETRIQRNQIARTIIELAQEAELGVVKAKIVRPVAQVEEKLVFRPYKGDIPGTLSFFKDGKRQVYQVPDWIYREANVLNTTISNPISSLIGTLNGISRAAFTSFSPPFVISNVLNDQLTAFVRQGVLPWETARVLLGSLKGLEGDVGWQTFQLAGGYQARFFGPQAAKDIIKSAQVSGGKVIAGQTITEKIKGSFLNTIAKAGELGEQATRRAAFERQLNKTLPGWRAMSPEVVAKTPQARKAAADSVEATINFARGGYLAKNANPFVIFLNANMEAMKLPMRTLRESNMAKLRLAGVLAGYTGLNAYNMSYPEYFDVPNDVRWGSIIVMLPSKEKDVVGNPKPNYFSIIPRTREWAAFIGPMVYAMEKIYKDSPVEFGRFTKVLAPMLLPVSGIPVAPVLEEIYEQKANWDFYRSEPIVSPELETLPPEEQLTPWTSRTIAEISSRLKQSPVRMQHIAQSIFGGAGAATTSLTDYIINLIAPREVPERIQDLVAKYKEADITERNRMIASLPAEDREAMYKELRQPEPTIPIVSPVLRRIYGPRGGQLYRTGAELAEKQYGISPKQTSKASQTLQKMSDLYLTKQQDLDTSVVNEKINKIEWREARQDLGKEYQGALNTIGIMFPTAAQVQQDKKKSFDYYQSLYTLAGAIPDLRTRAQVLAAGWYAIELNEPEPGTKDWDTFFQMREEYKGALSDENRQILEDYLQSRMTPMEQQYTQAQEILRPIWDVGKKVLANYPQLAAIYNQIMALPAPRRDELLKIHPVAEAIAEKKSDERKRMRMLSYDIDKALVEWYGYSPKNPRLMLEKRLGR